MDDYADGMRLKNTLSHEVRVTQTSRGVTKLRALSACSHVVQLARVGVRVLDVDVVCVMLVLIRSQFSVVGDVLFTISVQCSECQQCEKFKQARTNDRSNCESHEGSQMS